MMRAASLVGLVMILVAVAAEPSIGVTRVGRAPCAIRAEPGAGSDSTPPVAGRIAGSLWVGVPSFEPAFAQPQPGRDVAVKTPVVVRARHHALVRVAARQAPHAGLLYSRRAGRARRVAGADRAVRFTACAADQPRFSDHRPLGPFTFWAGAVMVDAPRCVRLETFVDGIRRRDLLIPVGRACPSRR